jgi:nicotinamidase-related amidase
MNRPRTLLEIAGFTLPPASWGKAALILIDHQMEYVTGGVPLPDVELARAELGKLLALARSQGAPVFHVVHHAKPGAALFNPEGPQVAIMPGLEPAAREKTIVKGLPNAFAKTPLDEMLKACGRKEIVLGGFATHMCVSATARTALDLGYQVTVVAKACATRDLPDRCGSVIPAEVVHQVALAELADRFAAVVGGAEEIL